MDLETEVGELEHTVQQLQGDLADALQECAEYESQLYAARKEHGALEKDYDTLLAKLEDVEHECTSHASVSRRAGERWRTHLNYLREFWPEVETDMLLRGDIK